VPPLPPNCLKVQAALSAAGADSSIVMLAEPAPTAAAAAALLQVPVGSIANSLVFSMAAGTPVLVLTSGAHRVDTAKVAALLATPVLTRAAPDFVRRHTGQIIGGVAPLGHPQPLLTVLDVELARFPLIWAAAGVPHSVFAISYPQLLLVTGAREAEVA
jgi:prolyl-tRNA editing enzyme YbaK/EbsC (Cys-tRNA(Pro) deacylase)